MLACCTNNVASNLLFPDEEFLQVMVARHWKFQKFLTVFLLGILTVTVAQSNSVGGFYALICLVTHCITLACGRVSAKVLLAASTVGFVVDAACLIMAHPETQNTFWLSFYGSLPGNRTGPPCPECLPGVKASWLFGISISYLLVFTIPFRNSAFVLPPCFAAYVSCLVYARYFSGRYVGWKRKNVHHTTVDELLLLSAMMVVAVVAKFLMESSEFKLWLALHDSRKMELREKILRFEAEYANECIKAGAEASSGDTELSVFQDNSCSGELDPRAPHSQASAPPVLESVFGRPYTEDERMALRCAFPHGSDCLQPDDTVWTNEAPRPIPVKQVLKGHHVLCYDHLSKSLKHAKVLNVVAQEGIVQWATVTLVDGTSIRVTADHPFLTQAYGRQRSLTPTQPNAVRAGDLKPHDDKVLVMKLVPVGVQSISVDSLQGLEEQTRISIDIQHPDRHSVFVSRADKSTTEHAMAIGASNLDVMGQEYSVRADKTFVSVHLQTPALRRTNSSPGRLQDSTTTVTHTRCSAPAQGTFCSSSTSSDSTHSYENDCTIRIGSTARPVIDASGRILQVSVVPNSEMQASLREYLAVREAGIPSLGSFDHKGGRCPNACWFENQRQHGRLKRCSVGVLCGHCHFDHDLWKRGRRSSNA